MGECNDFQIFTDIPPFLRDKKVSTKTSLRIRRNAELDFKLSSFKVIRRKILLYVTTYLL